MRAFHGQSLVVLDEACLHTLPKRSVRCVSDSPRCTNLPNLLLCTKIRRFIAQLLDDVGRSEQILRDAVALNVDAYVLVIKLRIPSGQAFHLLRLHRILILEHTLPI